MREIPLKQNIINGHLAVLRSIPLPFWIAGSQQDIKRIILAFKMKFHLMTVTFNRLLNYPYWVSSETLNYHTKL